MKCFIVLNSALLVLELSIYERGGEIYKKDN